MCLFLWVVFVFVIPVIASNFAESFVGIASRDNLDRVLRDIDKAREEAISRAFKAEGIPEGWSCWWCSSDEDGAMEIYGSSRSGFENFRHRAMISEPIRIDYADKDGPPQQAYLDSLTRQARRGGLAWRSCLRRAFSGPSPRPSAGRTWLPTPGAWM